MDEEKRTVQNEDVKTGADDPKPEKQLDYILYSSGIEPVRCKVGSAQASDHLPVLFEFRRRAEN